jgi:hypothetical protein
MKRLIAAFAAALMIAVGAPGVASASEQFDTQDRLVHTTNTCADGQGSWFSGNGWKFTVNKNTKLSKIQVAFGSFASLGVGYGWPERGAIDIYEFDSNTIGQLLATFSIGSHPGVGEQGIATYTNGTPLNLNTGRSYLFQLFNSGTCFVNSETFVENGANVVFSGNFTHYWPGGYESQTDDGGVFEEAIGASFALFSSSTTDPLTTTTPTLKRNGISFTPDNFDPTCAYEISTTAGTVKQNPVTGEVNVYGVGSGSSVTVTITDCTGATATVSGKATAATAPVQTLTKPTVATAADLITCSAGTSTVNPTSIAYTLLVDGVAVSTRFSDGAIAPSLVATTAAQNLYTGATLSKATWTVDPAWAGKSYSCTTTSYASGAVGIANS